MLAILNRIISSLMLDITGTYNSEHCKGSCEIYIHFFYVLSV